MFAIFLRFALNVLADSIAVSKFVNIDRVLQIQIQIENEQPRSN